MVTPGISAPELSVTVPPTVANSPWPNAGSETDRSSNMAAPHTANFLIISSLGQTCFSNCYCQSAKSGSAGGVCVHTLTAILNRERKVCGLYLLREHGRIGCSSHCIWGTSAMSSWTLYLGRG